MRCLGLVAQKGPAHAAMFHVKHPELLIASDRVRKEARLRLIDLTGLKQRCFRHRALRRRSIPEDATRPRPSREIVCEIPEEMHQSECFT